MPARLLQHPDFDSADSERTGVLQDLLEGMQVAGSGSLAFDAAIVDAFDGLPGLNLEGDEASQLSPGPHCSTVLVDVMGLLPADYNFSLGRRDGVCWAWIQPNDDWRPADGEARHDHPGGSGLAVADTPVLAVACAAIRLHIRLIKQRQRSALHRLIYVSQSRLTDPENELRDIVAVSRSNNVRNGVTGVLLMFEDGVFAHVLEGAASEVDSGFARLRRDPRHAVLRILQSVPICTRRYPGWPMGFARSCTDRPRFEDFSADAVDDFLELLLQLE